MAILPEEKLLIAPLVSSGNDWVESINEINVLQDKFHLFADKAQQFLPDGIRLANEYRLDESIKNYILQDIPEWEKVLQEMDGLSYKEKMIAAEKIYATYPGLHEMVSSCSMHDIRSILRNAPENIPFILTARIDTEGGRFPLILEHTRRVIYIRAIRDHNPFGIDVETALLGYEDLSGLPIRCEIYEDVSSEIKQEVDVLLKEELRNVCVIGSKHLFPKDKQPHNLEEVADETIEQGQGLISVVKNAIYVPTRERVIQVLELIPYIISKGYPAIVVPMAPEDPEIDKQVRLARCIVPLIGGTGTFGCAGTGTAKGQPPIDIMVYVVSELYNRDLQNRGIEELMVEAEPVYAKAEELKQQGKLPAMLDI